jgi:hypothetical protein
MQRKISLKICGTVIAELLSLCCGIATADTKKSGHTNL